VHGIGLGDPWPGAPGGMEVDANGVPIAAPLPQVEERRSILDLFRN
jgi:penicillin-binding protein 1A